MRQLIAYEPLAEIPYIKSVVDGVVWNLSFHGPTYVNNRTNFNTQVLLLFITEMVGCAEQRNEDLF